MAWTEKPSHLHSKPEAKLTLDGLGTHTLSPAILQVFLSLLLVLVAFADLCFAGPPQPALPPLLSGQPFIIFWGILDSSCSGRPDPRSFGMEPEGRVAVFYEDTLGNYPYFVSKDMPVNGGLPQHTRLDTHLQKTRQDLEAALPAPRYLGLGVVRWGEWLPQWSRNRAKQAMYLEASRKLLKTFFPSWSQEEVEKWSKIDATFDMTERAAGFNVQTSGNTKTEHQQSMSAKYKSFKWKVSITDKVDFEAAAQSVMMETLREVKRLRPKALWGVSPYPSCYSGDPSQTTLANYTGQCAAAEMALNDELLWLWKCCSALYPLLNLDKVQSGSAGARLYLSNQIKEALRVSSLTSSAFDLPVFPMVKSFYASTNTFLSQADLISTIGESAAMGTAGVVIWEKRETKTERECQDLGEFVSKVLGPYSFNVTTAARLCSASLCQGKGRCVRQNPDSSAYLQLPPPPEVAEKATRKPEEAKATEELEGTTNTAEPDPAEIWKKDFQCQWYKTADGDVSDQLSPKDGAPAGVGVDQVDALRSTTASLASVTKAASVSGGPPPSLDVPTDGGPRQGGAPNPTALLLLMAVGLYIEP